MADCKKRTVTRKTTTGSTTLVTDTGVVYGPTAKLERIIVNQPGDQCQLTVYDGSTVIYQGILGDEATVMGKPQRPYEIAFGGAEIAGDLKVALSVPAATSHYKMNEITGTSVPDSGSNASDGTCTNMANDDWVAGKIFNALDFDGSNDHVLCGNVNAFDTDEAFSFSLWMYAHALDGTEYLFAKRQVSTEIGYGCYIDVSNVLWFHILGTPSSSSMIVKTAIVIAENELNLWWHYTITYDGSQDATGIKIYRQAHELKTQITDNDIAGTSVNTTQLEIGAMRAGGNAFDGLIDDFRVYDVELTPEQIHLIYNEGRGTEDDFALADISVVYME